VEVLQRYSRSPEALERVHRFTVQVQKEVQRQDRRPKPRPRHSLALRLPTAVLHRVVEDYRAGATSRDIAKRYGISKTAVLRLLRTGGAAVRPRGPAPGCPLQAALAPER